MGAENRHIWRLTLLAAHCVQGRCKAPNNIRDHQDRYPLRGLRVFALVQLL